MKAIEVVEAFQREVTSSKGRIMGVLRSRASVLDFQNYLGVLTTGNSTSSLEKGKKDEMK